MRMVVMLLSLLACGTAGAQECPKYQHPHTHLVFPTICPLTTNPYGCMAQEVEDVPLTCVDDLHVVTEAEWHIRIEQEESLEREVRDLRLALASRWQALQQRDDALYDIIWRVERYLDDQCGGMYCWSSGHPTLADSYNFHSSLYAFPQPEPEQPQQTALIEDVQVWTVGCAEASWQRWIDEICSFNDPYGDTYVGINHSLNKEATVP